jgi:dethiobiotin synthetase
VRGIFVTGTGTEVGKTVAAAVIARSLVAGGETVSVFKPALSGLDEPGEPDHEVLRRASGTEQSDDEIAPYRFGPAVSPHLAAEIEGRPIDPATIITAARRAGKEGTLVCEGVGGLLVPITWRYLVRDFARDLGLPLVIVASPSLGTINHTLLTLEAARAVGLHPVAVVLNPWPDEPGRLELDNERTVGALGRILVTRLPRIDLSAPDTWPGLKVPLGVRG